MRRILVSFLAGLTVIAVGCAKPMHPTESEGATYSDLLPPKHTGFSDLWRDSDTVVVAVVDKQEVSEDTKNHAIYTTSVFRVQKNLKGTLQLETTVPLRFVGGELNGRKFPLLGPIPEVGTSHLLFLTYRNSYESPHLPGYWLTEGIWSRAEIKADGHLEMFESAFDHPLRAFRGKTMMNVEKAVASLSTP